ncbi:MAG: CBS domain-containing protein [Pyrinomonadaceae bacterium]|jgi:CBS domain-containing protein|nr:CBS domain-containing protein [Acidobacteriota bacterium]
MSERKISDKSRTRCREIMTSKISAANGEMTLQTVAKMLRDGDIGILPVIEKETNKLLGLVTDRDIVVRAVAEGRNIETPVSEIMTTTLYTAKPDDFAFQAIRTMGDKQVRRVPIVDDEGVLQGIVSMADVALEMEDEREIAETLEEISSGAGFWKKN